MATVADKWKFKIYTLRISVTFVSKAFYHIHNTHIFCGIYYIYSLLLLNIHQVHKIIVPLYIFYLINFPFSVIPYSDLFRII